MKAPRVVRFGRFCAGHSNHRDRLATTVRGDRCVCSECAADYDAFCEAA